MKYSVITISENLYMILKHFFWLTPEEINLNIIKDIILFKIRDSCNASGHLSHVLQLLQRLDWHFMTIPNLIFVLRALL